MNCNLHYNKLLLQTFLNSMLPLIVFVVSNKVNLQHFKIIIPNLSQTVYKHTVCITHSFNTNLYNNKLVLAFFFLLHKLRNSEIVLEQ